jgi:hypothetical protein
LGRTEEESSSVTLILLTTIAPHPLTEELSRQGYQVNEALAVSELFRLVEQHPTATILITADVDQERAKLVQQHYPTLHLKPAAISSSYTCKAQHPAIFAQGFCLRRCI